MPTTSFENIVDRIEAVFRDHGDAEYLGEPVTMSQHMLQAAHLAELQGEAEDIVVAALLHDIGHFTGEMGAFTMEDVEDRYHEDAGAVLLDGHFPARIVDCVKYHVAAKRYLCATDVEYYDLLSEASRHSLKLQGGAMPADECAQMQRNPNLDAILKVRRLDEAAKDPQMQTPAFAHYRGMIERQRSRS